MAFEQNKVTLCWPNLIDRCALSSASTFLRPLTRLQKRVLDDRAITGDTSPAITVTLDQPRAVGVVAMFAHNLSAQATWRVRVYDDADQLLEDSGTQDVWPALFQSYELAWESEHFWAGTISEEDRERFTSQAIWFADKAWIAAKIVIDISDGTNAEGVVSLGRLFLGDVFQPEYNISYGIRWGFTARSTVGETEGKVRYFRKEPELRQCSMSFDWLSEAEAFSRLFRMRRDVGITEEMLFAQQLNKDIRFLQRTMLCTAERPDPIVHPDAARHTHALSLTEIL